MWPELPEGVLYISEHFSLLSDSYINRPKAHVCNISKIETDAFTQPSYLAFMSALVGFKWI